MHKFLILFAFTILVKNFLAQSTSVFDATYFDKDNTAPPLKIGKGFHINDVYKQTRSCFTPESSKQSNLSSQQTGGKKTTIKLYHTTTNEEYNNLRKIGVSGKVNFLNLFSFGGSKLEEYANKTLKNEERVVFTANVDFGIYSFDPEPQLTEEAKGLISQRKLSEFVNFFGSHYISGVRKESTIYVILTSTQSQQESSDNKNGGINGSANDPRGWKGAIQAENSENINSVLKNGSFTAEIEIHGPGLSESSLKGQITNVLNGNNAKKAEAISAIIEGALKNISDPSQSIITQYYYSPFSLYGLNGIYWDEKKQNELTKLNEAIVSVYSAKSRISEMITESGKQQYIGLFEDLNVDETGKQKFLQAYEKSRPAFVNLNTKAEIYLKALEAKYMKCSDIYCPNTTTCCTNDEYIQEIEKFGFSDKIEAEEFKLLESIMAVAMEVSAPECEKKKMGVIKIVNHSSNPYSLYQGDKFIQTIAGKEIVTFTVALGDYRFKAVQDSGYLMYATVNYRNASLQTVCEEAVLKIGFED